MRRLAQLFDVAIFILLFWCQGLFFFSFLFLMGSYISFDLRTFCCFPIYYEYFPKWKKKSQQCSRVNGIAYHSHPRTLVSHPFISGWKLSHRKVMQVSKVSDGVTACVPGSVFCFLSGENRMSLLTHTLWQSVGVRRTQVQIPCGPHCRLLWHSVTASVYTPADCYDRQPFYVLLFMLDRMAAASSRKVGSRSFLCG